MRSKRLLTLHLVASLGWVGALAVFLTHAVAAVLSKDEQMVRAASLAMGVTAWFVILPFSVATVATGLAQALGSAWGLLRHYWIAFKLVLTSLATIVLLVKLSPIDHLAAAASTVEFSVTTLSDLRISLLLHAAGGLVVLLAAAALAVYKPAGLTPFAARGVATPRWVKAWVTALALLFVIVIAMLLGGGHGPRAHL